MSKIITIVGRGFGRRCSHHCVKPTGMGQNCQKWAQPAAELDLSSNLVYINLLLITKQNLDPHRIPWMVGLGKLLLLGLAKCPQLNKSNHPSTRDGGQHDLSAIWARPHLPSPNFWHTSAPFGQGHICHLLNFLVCHHSAAVGHRRTPQAR